MHYIILRITSNFSQNIHFQNKLIFKPIKRITDFLIALKQAKYSHTEYALKAYFGSRVGLNAF
jgi:hypothetical protein